MADVFERTCSPQPRRMNPFGEIIACDETTQVFIDGVDKIRSWHKEAAERHGAGGVVGDAPRSVWNVFEQLITLIYFWNATVTTRLT